MKKSLKCLIAATASVVSSAAFATTNMEDPLYMPKNRELYLKAGGSIMYKTIEKTIATEKKGIDGNEEFPVWRFTGDIGYGITDRLDIHGRFGYTKDDDCDREGMHRGRVGLTLRALTEEDIVIFDVYADAYLSGITPMKGAYSRYGSDAAFDFDNYSNGRWGTIAGVRAGKRLGKWTLAAHAEYLQTFGNHNNEIAIDPELELSNLGFPDKISVNLKSTHETTFGFDTMFQMSPKWSLGAGFEYIEHYDNGVEGIHTKLHDAGELNYLQQIVKNKLLAETIDMNDGWDEYVIKANAGYQMTDSVQLIIFGEYTFDEAHSQSQNATDLKMELGARFNARF
nr:hypothetical protein [Candidatus Enterousia merdequi]